MSSPNLGALVPKSHTSQNRLKLSDSPAVHTAWEATSNGSYWVLPPLPSIRGLISAGHQDPWVDPKCAELGDFSGGLNPLLPPRRWLSLRWPQSPGSGKQFF